MSTDPEKFEEFFGYRRWLTRACRRGSARGRGPARGRGVIAYPTEAVFGLGCDPGCETALARIAAIKRRRFTKGLLLIGADGGHLEPFVRPDWMDWVERHLVRDRRPLGPPR